MDDERFPALFAEGQSNQLVSVKHTATEDPRLIRHGHHLFGQRQLRHCLATAVLGKFCFKICPELLNGSSVRLGADGTEFRVRPLFSEFLDMIPLAGIAPPGKQLKIFFVVEIVLPCADVAHPHIGIARQQNGRFFFGDDRNFRLDAVFDTVGLNGGQGGFFIPLRPGHRVIERHSPLAFAADDQAACRFRPCIVQRIPPHEFHAGGIFAQRVVAVLIVAPQRCRVPRRDAFKCQHKPSHCVFSIICPNSGSRAVAFATMQLIFSLLTNYPPASRGIVLWIYIFLLRSSACGGSGSWCRPAWSSGSPDSCLYPAPRRKWRPPPPWCGCRCGQKPACQSRIQGCHRRS